MEKGSPGNTRSLTNTFKLRPGAAKPKTRVVTTHTFTRDRLLRYAAFYQVVRLTPATPGHTITLCLDIVMIH